MKPLIPLPIPGSGESRWRDRVKIGLAFLLVASPVILMLLPSDSFDEGPVICPFRRFLGLECPGCGLTRATQHFLHGEWEVALDYNPLVVVVVPFLGLVWAAQLIALLKYGRAYYRHVRGCSEKSPDCIDDGRQTEKTILSTGKQVPLD